MEKRDLSDSQKEEMSKLRTAQQKMMVKNMAATKLAGLEMKELMQADDPDRSAIDAKMREISDLRMKTQSLRIDHWFAVREILTVEQRSMMKEAVGTRGIIGRSREHRRGARMGRRAMPREHERQMERRERLHR